MDIGIKPSVKELEDWVMIYFDKHKYCGEWDPEIGATEENAHKLAQSIYARIENKCDMCREMVDAIHIVCEVLEERINEKV